MRTHQALDVQLLVSIDNDDCVSLVLNTQNRLNRSLLQKQFEEQIHTVKKEMDRKAIKPIHQDAIIDALDSLLIEPEIWMHLSNSLIVYVSPTLFQLSLSDEPYQNRVYVGPEFLTKYVLPCLFDGCEYHVLWIKHHQVHLFSVANHQWMHHTDTDFPQDVLEVTEHHNIPYRTQTHTSGLRIKNHEGFFTGAGEKLDMIRDDTLRFYRAIDAVLMKKLKHSTHPLILVGDKHHMALYRSISLYPNLMPDSLAWDNRLDEPALFKATQTMMEELYHPKEALIETIESQQLKKNTKVELRYEQVVQQALEHNIDTLMLWMDEQHLDDQGKDQDEHLARSVFTHHGTIYPWHQTAALLRHPL